MTAAVFGRTTRLAAAPSAHLEAMMSAVASFLVTLMGTVHLPPAAALAGIGALFTTRACHNALCTRSDAPAPLESGAAQTVALAAALLAVLRRTQLLLATTLARRFAKFPSPAAFPAAASLLCKLALPAPPGIGRDAHVAIFHIHFSLSQDISQDISCIKIYLCLPGQFPPALSGAGNAKGRG
jgi:hypothetical protein